MRAQTVVRTLRDVYTIVPSEATRGQRFFVIELTIDGLIVIFSGRFASNRLVGLKELSWDTPADVWFDGDFFDDNGFLSHEMATVPAGELGLAPSTHPTLLCVKSMADLHSLEPATDGRPPHMRVHYCDCGALRLNGVNCPEYPDCLIP
jgi:hypothetical protein